MLVANKLPIRKQSMEKYPLYMEKIFAVVGNCDPIFNTVGRVNFRLGLQLAAYARQYTFPPRVRPIPITILHCFCVIAK